MMTASPKRSIARSAAELALSLAVLAPALAAAQAPGGGPLARALTTWIALPASPGYEGEAMRRIAEVVPGWTRDPMGNLVRRLGSGSPRRVVACGIDEAGYAVSEITDEGYLRVHGAGNARQHPLWDQFHEGQRVAVVTGIGGTAAAKPLPGVFAVRSTHLWRRRGAQEQPTSIEDLVLDVGARSRTEVERLGIRMLDPVVREWPAWTVGEYAAGPAAADRAGCAAVAMLASGGAPSSGETVLIISAQRAFSWVGLSSALARLGATDTLVLLGAPGSANADSVAVMPARAPWPAGRGPQPRAVVTVTLPARYAGTLAESVREGDLTRFFGLTRTLAAIPGAASPPTLAPAWSAPAPNERRDSLSKWGDLLGALTDVYAVSGHEQPMRDAVMRALPSWARSRAVVDTAGDIVVAAGPERDTVVFVAHMDEIGLEVTRIAPDGTVSLRTRGGFFPSLFEGQTALLHRPTDRIPARDARLGCGAARGAEGPLRGVFVPRDSADRKQPGALTAWFGLDSAQLAAAGVVPGLSVTSFKCSTRLAATRFTARSIDDRAGSTTLALALADIDPAALDHKVVFAWSVREETGLDGARALAAQLGPSVRRVYAVDTFVSSDSPLESSRFALTPIGDGAVLRSLDNSSATPPNETERVVRIARAHGIPVQVGTTNGGNDGSELVRLGAVDVPLSWPLRYSHSPAEVIDLRDIRSLARLIAAVARER